MKQLRIFWSCILPEELIAKHGLSFAACNFSFNLMSGGMFDKVYSTMPLYVGGKMEERAFADDRFELVYDSFRKRGGIFQRIATLKEQWTIFKRIPKHSILWFYNLNTLNALLFILLKLFKPSVQLNVIVLDFTPPQSMFALNSFYLKLINAAHGRICLANSPLFERKNAVTLPGVVPKDTPSYPTITEFSAQFLISGALVDEIAMLPMLLKAFEKMPDKTLHITGKAPDIALIDQYIKRCPNIVYHGMLTYKEYVELLHKVPFLLSTRNPDYPENQCNFPSKIIEALLHNRIIVSTIQYEQLAGIKYFEVPSSTDAFISSINEIVSHGDKELLVYANQSVLVKEKFSVIVWNEFVSRIEHEKL